MLSVRRHVQQDRDALYYSHQQRLHSMAPMVDDAPPKSSGGRGARVDGKAIIRKFVRKKDVHDENKRLSAKLASIYARDVRAQKDHYFDPELDRMRRHSQASHDHQRLMAARRTQAENALLVARLSETPSMVGARAHQRFFDEKLRNFARLRARPKKAHWTEYVEHRQRTMENLLARHDVTEAQRRQREREAVLEYQRELAEQLDPETQAKWIERLLAGPVLEEDQFDEEEAAAAAAAAAHRRRRSRSGSRSAKRRTGSAGSVSRQQFTKHEAPRRLPPGGDEDYPDEYADSNEYSNEFASEEQAASASLDQSLDQSRDYEDDYDEDHAAAAAEAFAAEQEYKQEYEQGEEEEAYEEEAYEPADSANASPRNQDSKSDKRRHPHRPQKREWDSSLPGQSNHRPRPAHSAESSPARSGGSGSGLARPPTRSPNKQWSSAHYIMSMQGVHYRPTAEEMAQRRREADAHAAQVRREARQLLGLKARSRPASGPLPYSVSMSSLPATTATPAAPIAPSWAIPVATAGPIDPAPMFFAGGEARALSSAALEHLAAEARAQDRALAERRRLARSTSQGEVSSGVARPKSGPAMSTSMSMRSLRPVVVPGGHASASGSRLGSATMGTPSRELRAILYAQRRALEFAREQDLLAEYEAQQESRAIEVAHAREQVVAMARAQMQARYGSNNGAMMSSTLEFLDPNEADEYATTPFESFNGSPTESPPSEQTATAPHSPPPAAVKEAEYEEEHLLDEDLDAPEIAPPSRPWSSPVPIPPLAVLQAQEKEAELPDDGLMPHAQEDDGAGEEERWRGRLDWEEANAEVQTPHIVLPPPTHVAAAAPAASSTRDEEEKMQTPAVSLPISSRRSQPTSGSRGQGPAASPSLSLSPSLSRVPSLTSLPHSRPVTSGAFTTPTLVSAEEDKVEDLPDTAYISTNISVYDLKVLLGHPLTDERPNSNSNSREEHHAAAASSSSSSHSRVVKSRDASRPSTSSTSTLTKQSSKMFLGAPPPGVYDPNAPPVESDRSEQPPPVQLAIGASPALSISPADSYAPSRRSSRPVSGDATRPTSALLFGGSSSVVLGPADAARFLHESSSLAAIASAAFHPLHPPHATPLSPAHKTTKDPRRLSPMRPRSTTGSRGTTQAPSPSSKKMGERPQWHG